jgi:hypothetical protein
MASSSNEQTGWALLHLPVPPQALKVLSNSVYGVSGLSDVNEAYMIERLHASELSWSWELDGQPQYLGKDIRKGQNGPYELFLAAASGTLSIETEKGSGVFRRYSGAGASDNRKLDAAFKGAATVAFKNALKLAGLTLSVYKDGKAIDIVYDLADGTSSTGHVDDERKEPKGAGQSAQAHPEAKVNAAAADAKEADAAPAEAVPQATKPLTAEQTKTLLHLVESLPSNVAAADAGEEMPISSKRIGAFIKAAEVRSSGSGYSAALGKLGELHANECGAGCEHIQDVAKPVAA